MDNKITLTWQLQSTHITATEICLTLSKVNWLITLARRNLPFRLFLFVCYLCFLWSHLTFYLVIYCVFDRVPRRSSRKCLSLQKSASSIPWDKHFHPLSRIHEGNRMWFSRFIFKLPICSLERGRQLVESRGSVNRMRTYVRRSSFIIQTDVGVGL